MSPPLLRIVGPPGSGKTLLITSLTEALRQRGYRVASAALRDEAATVVTLPNGGRVTIARALEASELSTVVASLDPHIDVLLAESFAGAGSPAIELSPPGEPTPITPREDLLAVVASARVAVDFAVVGPGDTQGLAKLVEERVLGRAAPEPTTVAKPGGLFGRWRRR